MKMTLPAKALTRVPKNKAQAIQGIFEGCAGLISGAMSDSRLRFATTPANLPTMPTLAIVFGLILDALGLGAYFFSEAKSVTALIPAFFGTTILLCGIIGTKFHKARMHVMHVAALVGLLGTLGGLGMGLPKVGALLAGTAERPMAVTMQIVMGVVSLVFLALCVKSFVDARILKKYSKQ
jgi:lysylphosphatidylglycerol synthetase-like protein (DUF2156 family)